MIKYCIFNDNFINYLQKEADTNLNSYAYYYWGRVSLTDTERFKLIQISADLGNSSAQNLLGRYHQQGHGCKKDEKEAIRLLKLSNSLEFDRVIIKIIKHFMNCIFRISDKISNFVS